MKTADQIIRPWARTTSPAIHLSDSDRTTLFAMIQKGLDDQRLDTIDACIEAIKAEHDSINEDYNSTEKAMDVLRELRGKV